MTPRHGASFARRRRSATAWGRIFVGAILVVAGAVGLSAPATSLEPPSPFPAADPAPSQHAVVPSPDVASELTGGIAARLYVDGHRAVAGEVYYLMARAGSAATAKVYDQTPYTHPVEIAANTAQSNAHARSFIEHLTGEAQPHLEFTTPPGGGASGGATYAIGYLNELTDGGFTADLAVAVTGTLNGRGKIGPISAIDEKTVAAAVAGVDVLFTPSRPRAETASDLVGRRDGSHHAVNSGSTAESVAERWEHFIELGASRPAGLDIIGVRHLGDIAAYLCGAGTAGGCRILDLIEADVEAQLHGATSAPPVRNDREVSPAGVR